jgi:hypothetical protein
LRVNVRHAVLLQSAPGSCLGLEAAAGGRDAAALSVTVASRAFYSGSSLQKFLREVRRVRRLWIWQL